jgi:hypothetical protein
MSRRASSPSQEAKDTMRALRRAAKNALELGLKTGTPVYVFRNNKIVDLTKEQRTSKKPSKGSSRKTDSRKTDRVKAAR